MGFSNKKPSNKYRELFLTGHNLELRVVRQVEDRRVMTMTPEHVSEHIALVHAAMNLYNTHDPSFIFNMDQSGCSFGKSIGRSLKKGVGRPGSIKSHTENSYYQGRFGQSNEYASGASCRGSMHALSKFSRQDAALQNCER